MEPLAIQRLDVQVRGRVQGVGFRAFTRDQARRLGLVGWVRNERDGSVRAVAEGPRERLDTFLQALQRGPSASRVDGVTPYWSMPTGEFDDFALRHV